ncbi:hypothetical protein [Anaplasma phagocytophilum]|uniref:hypothetical protein n=1 Tax=Anaplasma phagocytophilum TaxID=948 RepID=UPI0007DFAD44|nr:hypothetical protein [Anaplasma phagocytophilum]SBO31972.1 hypothetical protein ANAPC4_00652 [Anaplasma phagocytophilum]
MQPSRDSPPRQEVRKSGSQEVRKSGSQEVRKSGSQEVRKSGSQEVRKFTIWFHAIYKNFLYIIVKLTVCSHSLTAHQKYSETPNLSEPL